MIPLLPFLVVQAPLTFASPNGHVVARVSTEGGVLRYAVTLDGRPALSPSEVGIRSDGIDFGQDVRVGAPKTGRVDESYPFFGAKAKAVDRARTVAIPLVTQGEAYILDLHVADDGVGVRLRLPAKTGRRVEADLSTWRFPGDPTVWAAGPYDASYEQTYRTATLKELGGKECGFPVTARVGGAYVTLGQAALKDYGDLGIKVGADGALGGYLPNDPQGWTTDREVVQPWRVTVVARDLTGLVNTTLVQNLNPPPDPALAKADWIRPGRSTWQWMAVGAPRFEDQRAWVDWTRMLGYEYYLVDEGWSGWKDPWPSLRSVCDYAKSQGVKVWLWVHSREVREPGARRAYFQKAAEAGIVGVKVDFPEPTNREWSSWYPETARDAAANRLLIDFHGATAPTGMERTWPNELSREGVRGHEWHITRYRRVLEPQHDTILPFTRYVVGHGDYTPTVFDPRELQGNTWAHELAQAVVFTSPFLCTGGHPRDYLSNPSRDVLAALPATWDETVVLPGSEPGRLVGMARRRGSQWFVALMNGEKEAAVDVPLRFLGRGSWKAARFGDVPGQPAAWDRSEEQVTAQSSFRAKLSARGGFVAWITKPGRSFQNGAGR